MYLDIHIVPKQKSIVFQILAKNLGEKFVEILRKFERLLDTQFILQN